MYNGPSNHLGGSMKIAKLLLLAIGLTFGSQASAFNVQQCEKAFGPDQLRVLKDAYFAGADRDHGYTLAAIAWQESSAGRNLVNPAGPAYGVFQNLSSTVHRRLEQNGVKTTRSRVAQRLIIDFGWSAEMAMAELDYWKGRHNGRWERMVASYYAGGNWSHSGGQGYLQIIRKKVQFLKQNECMFNEL